MASIGTNFSELFVAALQPFSLLNIVKHIAPSPSLSHTHALTHTHTHTHMLSLSLSCLQTILTVSYPNETVYT